MKKLLSFIFALCIVQCALLHARTECKTIAELKALETGSECAYVGNATTTYYYGKDGVLMQDSTGAILLRNPSHCLFLKIVDSFLNYFTK